MDEKNKVEVFKQWCQRHPAISRLIIVGIIIGAFGKLVDSVSKLEAFKEKHWPTNAIARAPETKAMPTQPPSETTADWNDLQWAEARANLEWIFQDPTAPRRYEAARQRGMSKYRAALVAQNHNDGSYRSIVAYGEFRTERYLKERGR